MLYERRPHKRSVDLVQRFKGPLPEDEFKKEMSVIEQLVEFVFTWMEIYRAILLSLTVLLASAAILKAFLREWIATGVLLIFSAMVGRFLLRVCAQQLDRWTMLDQSLGLKHGFAYQFQHRDNKVQRTLTTLVLGGMALAVIIKIGLTWR
jgi:hypothetical protein